MRAAKRASKALLTASGKEPSVDEVAEAIGMETERLARILWSVRESECVDGDAPIKENVDEPGMTRFSFIEDSQTISQFDLAFREELEQLIRQNFSPKHAEVLLQRFGFGDIGEQTLEEIGGRLGVTRERVRQIEEHALVRLGRILKGMIFRPKKDRGTPSKD
jgi:RNA polymerase primary sigma factor